MTQQFVTGEADLCFETFGDGRSGRRAHRRRGDLDGLVGRRALPPAGRRGSPDDPIRPRDTGRSATSPVGKPSYSSADLATDPLRILDALGIERAHVVGLSMGGGLAQSLAAQHPDRLLTLTLIATSPGVSKGGLG